MKEFLGKYLPANSFARGVAVLSGGTAAAQILAICAAPILTRLYSPEDFGVLAVFSSLLSILVVVASLRYEFAIPIAEDSHKALNLVALCLLIIIGVAMLTGFLVFLIGDWLANILNANNVAAYLWLLPIGVLLAGIYQTFNYWAVREKAFSRISETKLTQSISSLIIQFISFNLGPLGLISGYITGQVFGVSRLAKSAFDRADRAAINWVDIQTVAKRYRRFPQFTAWAGLLNTCGQQVPILLLAFLFDPAMVGIYAIANRVISSPLNVISHSVSTAFFAHSSDAYKAGHLATSLSETHQKLVQVVSPVAAVIFFFGPNIFSFIFGEKWQLSGSVSSSLMLMIIFSFTTSPLSMVFTTMEKQKLALFMQLNLLILRVLGVLVGASSGDFLTTIISFSVFSGVGYLCYLLVMFYVCNVPFRKLISNYVYVLLPAFISAAFFKVYVESIAMNQQLVLIIIAIVMIMYYSIMIKNIKND